MPGWPAKLSPLPRHVPPVPDEVTSCYVHRLAHANHIDGRELAGYLNPALAPPKGISHTFTIRLEDLAAVSGIPPAHLAYALPDLYRQYAGHEPRRRSDRPAADEARHKRLACRKCMAANNITTPVHIWARADNHVCLRHHLWIGSGVHTSHDQVEIGDLPEIGHAHTHHHNLSRRHGRATVAYFYDDARRMVDQATNLPSNTGRWKRLRYFLAREHTDQLPWSYDYAAYYPEVISLLAVLSSPYWRRQAISDNPTDRDRFYRRVAHNGPTRNLDTWINQQERDHIISQARNRTRQP